ncbi:MAG TPA: hypothetical protein VFU97_24415 [Xanthobacteraceae bacterium]|nr:hypothetical protein [Xanthobacteraceae bacterium]
MTELVGNRVLVGKAEWDKRTDPATGELVVDLELRARRAREWALYATPDQPNMDVDQILALVDRTATELLAELG